ncbi:uncharacterized protein B0J16DRAFT_61308 [Fusarium flagelliforme]|uniref:V-snare n=1 Tax=Fusarium flagelliforme TaxID=2675880 RepID=A0A395MQJ1_9HYPO|nr:uncharacterized protein B0J16DRAFT_61308 [Fusarium flagelliforme]KAH7192491.1 hypothetical protein B0J16DRAFT_61308 [Fusarium flagelliforme]RFN50017.1 hypothetical protein FIE12Z_5713 [Fusarium flagelliforme]
MTTKREFEDVDEGDASKPKPKRSKKHGGKARQHQNSGIDPTWGQKYVFADSEHATTIPAGEESEFEDDTDAMAYLNSVRQQAAGIPHLLVAPKVQIGPQLPVELRGDDQDDEDGPVDRSIYNDGLGDSRGWYEDGAYMAMPDDVDGEGDYEEGEYPEDEDDYDEEAAIREAYFASVMEQYLNLRNILHAEPPQNARSRLAKAQLKTEAPADNQSSVIATWSRILRDTDPHPLQVAHMSKDTTLRILRIMLGGKFLRRGYTLPERTSRWIWSLLARLPDKGELNYAEIGWIRDLGRRAVLLGRSLAEMAALRDELAEGGLGAHEAVDRSSSDEDVMADPEDLEIEGAVSADEDEEDSTPAETEQEVEQAPKAAEPTTPSPPKPDAEEGEIDEDEDEDVAMDIASDSDAEEGEVAAPEPQESLEAAKERLLAQIKSGLAPDDDEDAEKEAAKQRLRSNLRATLNMILTVAGEFYGQRDLLEFREPFVGM